MTNRPKNDILYLGGAAVPPITGCCAVGSAPALGAGGREFESRHSDHNKSHDEPFINAVLSWLCLLYECSKWAAKCDGSAALLTKKRQATLWGESVSFLSEGLCSRSGVLCCLNLKGTADHSETAFCSFSTPACSRRLRSSAPTTQEMTTLARSKAIKG